MMIFGVLMPVREAVVPLWVKRHGLNNDVGDRLNIGWKTQSGSHCEGLSSKADWLVRLGGKQEGGLRWRPGKRKANLGFGAGEGALTRLLGTLGASLAHCWLCGAHAS